MGYKLVKFEVTPEENQQIDVTIKVPKEPRSVIHGVVLDECCRPKKDAVVKLLKVCGHDPKHHECRHLEPITHTFTDEEGQFLFGPLCPHVTYVIKVWVNHANTKKVVIEPDECDDECIEDHDCDHNHDHNKCNNENQRGHSISEFSDDEE